MLEFLNGLFDVLGKYVDFLFQLVIVPGVSFGTLLLFVTVIAIIVRAFWRG